MASKKLNEISFHKKLLCQAVIFTFLVIIRKFGIPDRIFSRIKEPFKTIFPARSGSQAELSYADYIWVTHQKILENQKSKTKIHLTDNDNITPPLFSQFVIFQF